MATSKPVTLVSRHSDEFAKVEHSLQLSVRSTAVKDVSIWAISNPTANIQFERRAGSLLTLDAFVDVNTLGASNPIEEVCKRGFSIDSGAGHEFAVGNINFPENGQVGHQYLLCSVIVGRSYVVDGTEGGAPSGDSSAASSSSSSSSSLKLTPGYDSILHVGDMDQQATGNGGDSYRRRYIIFDSSQVLPRYVVHFTYDAKDGVSRAPIGSIDLSDIKTRIAETLAVLGPAAAEATEKMLSDIGDAYDASLAASQERDPLLEERKRSIEEALRSINGKLTAIQANSHAVEEELYQRMQAAMFALQDETQRKTNALLSEELELRRQLGEIEWNESFVRIMQESLPPMTFVSAWQRHAKLKSGLYASLGGKVSTRSLDEIQADLKLAGSIAVICERTGAAAGSSSSSSSASSSFANDASSTSGSTSTAAGARFFGNGAASSQQLTAPSSSSSEPATAEAVNEIWAAVLRGAMGGSSSASSSAAAAAMPSSSSSSSVPIVTVEQAQANLALAKANLAAIEATAAALPREVRAQMDGTVAEAAARVSQAEGTLAIKSGKPAAVVAPVSVAAPPTPSSSSSSSAVAPPPAPSAAAVAPSSTSRRAAATPAQALAPAAAVVSVVPRALQAPLEQRIARFSLRKEADRRRRQQRGGLDIDSSLAFPGSAIINSDQAATLYACLPYGQAVDDGMGGGGTGGIISGPSTTRLVFSTVRDADPTAHGLLTAYSSIGSNEPTVVLVRANGQIFGGYAADAWDLLDYFGGTPRSFLFSVTKDTKIPYTGRVKGPRQANDDLLRAEWESATAQTAHTFEQMMIQARELNGGAEPEFDDAGRVLVRQLDPAGSGQIIVTPVPVPRPKPFVRHDCLKSSPEGIQFGLADLVLTGDFTECTSELENSYGAGLRPEEARTFLAGAPYFRAEDVELWAVSSPAGMAAASGGATGGDFGGGGVGGGYGYATPARENGGY